MENNALDADFADFIAALNKHGVDYVVIGGHAVGFHGYARATEDLDVFVRRQLDNARKLKAAIEEFAGVHLDDQRFAATERALVHIGPEAAGIDVLNYFKGTDEDRVLKAAITANIDDLVVRFPTIQDLIANKRATGRDVDLIDLKHLVEAEKILTRQSQAERGRGGLEH